MKTQNLPNKYLIFLIIAVSSIYLMGCGGAGGGGGGGTTSSTTTTTILLPGLISGVVTLEGNNDHGGAIISVEGTALATTSVSSSGEYIIGNISPEVYTVVCSKTSFESVSISEVSVEADQNTDNVDFYLVPLGPPPPPF
jgi:hypothetical protein